MDKKITQGKNSPVFEQIKQLDERGNEFWSARDLAKALDYAEFRNFIPVIERAKEACKNRKHPIANHFVDFHEMVSKFWIQRIIWRNR